jgi:multidrug efflux system membrane fusion protein
MKISWILGIVCAAFLFLQGCEQQNSEVQVQPTVITQASTLTVHSVEIPARHVTSGTVTSDHRVSINSRISGYIRSLSVREGDKVKKGQVLVHVDPVNANQALVQAQADLSNARAELNRYEELFKARAETQQQLDRVRLRYKVARSQVKQARNQLSYAEVRSPVDGVVVEKRLSKGDLASPGAAILILEDPASLLVETHVSEQFVSGIHEADKVEIEISSLNRTFPGVVRQVVQAADAVSHQFLIKIALHSYEDVHPGMYAQVGFNIGSRKALMVPKTAVLERAGLNGIYIVDGENIARYRQIRIGQLKDDSVEVLAGLHDGDVISWNGNPSLRTGMQVQAR